MAVEKTYDDREALSILGACADTLRPNREEAKKAFRVLLVELDASARTLGFKCWRGDDDEPLCVDFPHQRPVTVTYGVETGRIMVRSTDGGGPAIEVPIAYETAAGKFVGTESDEFIVPVPGQPRARRSALAVLVEAITKAIGEQAARARE